MKALAIYGPGGFGREIAAFARRDREVLFISDADDQIGSVINGLAVLSLHEVAERQSVEVVIAVADATTRRRLADKCAAVGLPFGALVSPSHERGDNVAVGDGSVFCGQTVCTSDLKIGRHFHANIFSYVAHDCSVGDFVTLAPRVCINGNTIVEDDVYIGTGAILRQGTAMKPLLIGRGAVIGMGAVVTRDVPPGVTVIGNPARPMER